MSAGNVSETTTFQSFMQQGLMRTQLSECKDKIVMIIRSAVSNVTLIKCQQRRSDRQRRRAACLT